MDTDTEQSTTKNQKPVTSNQWKEGAGVEPDAVPGTNCFRNSLRYPNTFTFQNALTES